MAVMGDFSLNAAIEEFTHRVNSLKPSAPSTAAEDYGIAPLLSLYKADNIEAALPVLFSYAHIFSDIYDAISNNSLPENERAGTALNHLSAFSEHSTRYIEAVKSARY